MHRESVIAPRALRRMLVIDPAEDRAKVVKNSLMACRIGQVDIQSDAKSAYDAFMSEHYDAFAISNGDDDHLLAQVLKFVRQDTDLDHAQIAIIQFMSNPSRNRLFNSIGIGVDEIVAWPTNLQILRKKMTYLRSMPRKWVECEAYVGPCRRRSRTFEYNGADRRTEELGKRIAAA